MNKALAAKRIRKERMKKGLTQKEVAVEIGVCRPAYINLEKGRRFLGFEQMLKLEKLLDVRLG